MGLSVLIKGDPRERPRPFCHTRHREKVASSKPRRGPSPDIQSVSTLGLDVSASRTVRHKCPSICDMCYSSPSQPSTRTISGSVQRQGLKCREFSAGATVQCHKHPRCATVCPALGLPARPQCNSHIHQGPAGQNGAARATTPGQARAGGPTTHLDHVQLGDAVLLNGHRQRNPVFLYNHLGRQAFPSMGNCTLGLLEEVLK